MLLRSRLTRLSPRKESLWRTMKYTTPCMRLCVNSFRWISLKKMGCEMQNGHSYMRPAVSCCSSYSQRRLTLREECRWERMCCLYRARMQVRPVFCRWPPLFVDCFPTWIFSSPLLARWHEAGTALQQQVLPAQRNTPI